MQVAVQPANPLRIVVADGDAAARPGLVRALTSELGHPGAAEAGDGAEMVDRVLQNEIDLVVFDIHLPGLGGLDALKRIRETKSVAGVVLTDDASAETLQRALHEHVYGYLLKPFQPARDGP